jgi:assimilatory nitrate reductase catalytic subunit
MAWRHELAGDGAPESAFALLRARIGLDGAWLVLQDAASSVFRAALVADGRLLACVVIGPDADLPPRDWLASLLADRVLTIAERRALLSGRPASGDMVEAPVCVCFGIGAGAIRRAILAGCADVDGVGAATRAGTNCGSCRPEIRALLQMAVAVA